MQPKIVLFLQIIHQEIQLEAGIYILAIYNPHREIFCPNWKTGKNLKEDLKKRWEKGGKEEKKRRVIKLTLKYYEA